MSNEGLVLLVAWAGWFLLVGALAFTIAHRSHPPGDDDERGPGRQNRTNR